MLPRPHLAATGNAIKPSHFCVLCIAAGPTLDAGVATCGGADGAASEGGGGSAAPGAIDDPDWHADTPVNHLLNSTLAHQEGIKAATAVKTAALQGQVERERGRAEAAEVGRAAEGAGLLQQLGQERERAEAAEASRAAERAGLLQQLGQERERAEAAEAGRAAERAGLLQQLGQERERAESERARAESERARAELAEARAAAAEALLLQLQGAGTSAEQRAGLPGRSAGGQQQKVKRRRQL